MTDHAAHAKGKLDEPMVQAAIGDLTDAGRIAELSPATVLALRLVDVLTSAKPAVTPEFYAELRKEFSETQILELGSALSVASGWQRFIEAFGIRPDQWSPESD